MLKLKTAAQQVHVTIGYPRLQAGGSLVADMARHNASRVSLTVRATDGLKRTTRLTAKVKPRT